MYDLTAGHPMFVIDCILQRAMSEVTLPLLLVEEPVVS